jgi:hypothetical protein
MSFMNPKLLPLFPLAVLAGACASVQEPGGDFFDPAATARPARVLEKKIVRAYVRPSGPSVPRTYVPVTLTSDETIFVKFTALQDARGGSIDLFQYRVKTGDGRVVPVYTEYFAHGVGSCVTLTESRKASYPRIEPAPAGACASIPAA